MDVKQHFNSHNNTNHRVQELCKSRGDRPGPPVPNSPYGLCGRKATLNLNTDHSEPRIWPSGKVLVTKPVLNRTAPVRFLATSALRHSLQNLWFMGAVLFVTLPLTVNEKVLLIAARRLNASVILSR